MGTGVCSGLPLISKRSNGESVEQRLLAASTRRSAAAAAAAERKKQELLAHQVTTRTTRSRGAARQAGGANPCGRTTVCTAARQLMALLMLPMPSQRDRHVPRLRARLWGHDDEGV